MGRALLAPAILALSLAAFAQAPASAPDKSEAATSCTVSGQVVAAVGGSPLKSARVALIRQESEADRRPYTVMTEGEGRFTFKDIPPGRYEFLAVRNGYVDEWYQANGTGKSVVLSLQPGQHLTDVLFRLTMSAVITGHVNSEDGLPMAHFQVFALLRPTEEETLEEGLSPQNGEPVAVASAETDDRGQYRIFGLKPGEYYVRAVDLFEPMMHLAVSQADFIQQSLGSQYAPIFYPGVSDLAQAQPVSADAGEEVQVDFTMRSVKTAEVAGRLIGADGGPAAGGWVSLEEASGNLGGEHSTAVDAKGNFRLKAVPPGSYRLTAFQKGKDGRLFATRKLEVGSDNIESLTITLGEGSTFFGRITFVGRSSAAMDRIFVALAPVEQGQSWSHSDHPDKEGNFKITGVSDGNYAVRIYGVEQSWYAKSVRLGSQDLLTNGLQVEKGSTGGTIEIVLSNEVAMLEGSVTDHDGPAMGARIRITPDPETRYNTFNTPTARTDQHGRFSLQVRPGKYQIVAIMQRSGGGPLRRSDPQFLSLTEREHKAVQLTIPAETR